MTQTISRDEARDFYLRVFDEFAVVINDEHDSNREGRPVEDNSSMQPVVDAINARFKAAGADQTIVSSNVNGDYDAWQCWQTHDSISIEEAEALFDAAWPTTEVEVEAPAAKPKASSTVASESCHCGCGQPTSPGKGYLPGHDARHASSVAREILAAGATAKVTLRMLKQLPTEALQRKAQAQVARGTAKAAAKQAAAKAAK